MDEQIDVVQARHRRSRSECERLVVEFEQSGLSCTEFCRQRGLSLATLARYRRRRRQADAARASQWLAVELCNPRQAPGTVAGPSGLAVALPGGRRIEVGRGFDAHTLVQLVGLLERR